MRYRIFSGQHPHVSMRKTIPKPDPNLFYYEPENYPGDELWSEGYSSELIAAEAARLERECRGG